MKIRTLILIEIVFFLLLFLLLTYRNPDADYILLNTNEVEISKPNADLKKFISNKAIHNIDNEQYIIGLRKEYKIREIEIVFNQCRYVLIILLIIPILYKILLLIIKKNNIDGKNIK